MNRLFNLIINCNKRQNNLHSLHKNSKPYTTPQQYLRKIEESQQTKDTDDGPIKYTTSPAQYWRAKYSRQGAPDNEDSLWYEPYVLIGSIAVFLIYFTMIREENDIDVELSRSLYSRIDGLEENQLRLSLRYNIEHGLDTKDIVNRLHEIEMEKRQTTSSDE